MSIWNKIKTMFGFGKNDSENQTTTTTTIISAPGIEVTTEKPVSAKKTRKPKAKSKAKAKASVDSFEESVEKFKATLDKKKKPYFNKLVNEYKNNTDADLKNRVCNKITNYMNKNK